MTEKPEAVVITCIDFRIQQFIQDWLDQRYSHQRFDRVAIAGGIFDLSTILKQVEISSRLHDINTVVLINHEDCGAYGAAGTYEKHRQDLAKAAEVILKLYPRLSVETYYLHLDGTFERLPKPKSSS